jgi:hypothetical protein
MGMMLPSNLGFLCGSLAALLAMACGGKHLHEVGDVPGDGGAAGATNPGGATGMGGTSQLPGGAGGGGGTAPRALVCDTCEVLADTPGIRAIWASDRVYWIEYGSVDALGNHQDDGRLLSVSLDGKQRIEIATGLQAPIQLGITEGYAYVVLEQSSSPLGELQLAQVALDSGDVALIQAISRDVLNGGWFQRSFAIGAGYVFWYDGGSVYRLAEAAGAAPEEFLEVPDLVAMVSDGSRLYLQDADGIRSIPWDRATPMQLWSDRSSQQFTGLQLSGEYLFATERKLHDYWVVRLPKTGGSFTRLEEAASPSLNRLVIHDSSYIGDYATGVDPSNSKSDVDTRLVQGVLEDPASRQVLASVHNSDEGTFWRAWDATATTVYFAYDDQLYRLPRGL